MSGWHFADLLPGLYLAVLAALLLAALRRWFDPVSRRIVAVFAGLVAVLLFSSLFGGKVLLSLQILLHHPPFALLPPPDYIGNRLQLDLVAQITPALALVRRSLAAGAWPLWNPWSGAGMPLAGDPQSQLLAPLVTLAYGLPLERAAAVTAGLRIFVALVFGFLFLRRQGMSTAPAVAGSVAFGLGGFVLLWLGWPIANAGTFLPVVLYGLVMVEERGARRDGFLLIVALLGLLLAGQPEAALDAVLLAAAFALARLLSRPRRERGLILARWALAGAIAAAAAAPVVLPAADYLPQTHRGVRMEWRRVQVLRESPLAGWRTAAELEGTLFQVGQRILPVAAPNAWGNQRFGPYWGFSILNEDSAAFAGEAALLAALLAALPTAWRFRQERFFLAIAAVCLLILVRPPGTLQVLVATPLLGKSATYMHRVVLPLGFALSYLAACTLERWRAGELPRRWRLRVVVVATLLAAVIAWAYLDLGTPGKPHPHDALRGFRLGSLGVHLVALAAAALLLAWRSRSPGPWPSGPSGINRPRWPQAALVLVVAGELLGIHGPANPAMPKRLYFPTLAPVAFLQQHLGHDRFGGPAAVFFPNVPVIYGLADVRYQNPEKPYRVAVALWPILKQLLEIDDQLVPTEHPLYRFLGMRYQMTPADQRLPPPWRAALRDPAAWIWERPDALPRLFLPEAALVRTGTRWRRSITWRGWTARNRDFEKLALLQQDTPGPQPDGLWKSPAGDSSILTIRSIEPEHMQASVRLAARRPLASSVFQDGNWHLLLDRRPHATGLANGTFLGAWLPPGEHHLDLLYRPRTFLPGCLLAALGGVLALAWVVGPPPRLR